MRRGYSRRVLNNEYFLWSAVPPETRHYDQPETVHDQPELAGMGYEEKEWEERGG